MVFGIRVGSLELQHRTALPLLIAGIVGLACGKVSSRDDGTVGTADGAGATSVLAGAGSGASAGAIGGIGGVGVGGADATTAGANIGGQPPVVTDCSVVRTQRQCMGSCGLEGSFSVSCPGQFVRTRVAASNLLIVHTLGGALLRFSAPNLAPLFDWQDTDARFLSAGDDEQPIVVRVTADGLTLDPTPKEALPELVHVRPERTLDASFDAGTLRILGMLGSETKLWSVSPMPGHDVRLIDTASTNVVIVRESSPPWVLYRGTQDFFWQLAVPPELTKAPEGSMPISTKSVVGLALGNELLVASDDRMIGRDGTVFMEGAGISASAGSERSLVCPAQFIVPYPGHCEFEATAPMRTPGAILAYDLVMKDGDAWLVTLSGDVTDTCRTFISRCFETLDCDCSYGRFGSVTNARVEIANLRQSQFKFVVPLGELTEQVALSASVAHSGAIHVALGRTLFTPAGNFAGSSVEYLVVRQELEPR